MRTGVPCNENRFFPVRIDLQGVPCKPYKNFDLQCSYKRCEMIEWIKMWKKDPETSQAKTLFSCIWAQYDVNYVQYWKNFSSLLSSILPPYFRNRSSLIRILVYILQLVSSTMSNFWKSILVYRGWPKDLSIEGAVVLGLCFFLCKTSDISWICVFVHMMNYSLWDSSEISLKHGPSSGQLFSVKNPYFLSKW